jgi:hypothetical protein
MSEIEERIGLEIYRANQKGELIHFSKLIDRLLPLGITKSDVDKCLDKMSDICMIEEKWMPLGDGRWVKAIYISIEHVYFFEHVDVRVKGMEAHLSVEAFFDNNE